MVPPSTAVAAAGTAITGRLSDSHLVFPIWRTIRELQHIDGGIADLDSIAAHMLMLHGCPPLDRNAVSTALHHMTVDGLLLMDGDDCDTATFRLPVKSPISRSASVVTTSSKTAPETITADSDAADDDADDTGNDDDGADAGKQSLRGMHLLSACRVSRTRDPYCYECHRSGEVLPCAECPRTFHARCVRPTDQLDVPLLPLRDPVPEVVEKTFQLTFDQPYARVRAQQAKPGVRAAAVVAADDPLAMRMCMRCRILKRNAQHLRPLTPVDQLNDMVRFSFERIRSWIARDTFSTQEPKSLHIPAAYVRLLLPVLMNRPRTVADIQARIGAAGYRSPLDYLVDVLDVVHCIGVLRGTACADFEAAKYLQLDALHDITEMARCQDCYRHSIVQRSDAQWFVRPCSVPHRLVHAKMAGFSYWPAKVIRQVRRADAVWFDVRFFGGDHARALIAERFVVPDGRPVQLKKTVGLRKALEELAEHKACLERVAAKGVRDVDEIRAEVTGKSIAAAAVPSEASTRKRGRPSSRAAMPVPPKKSVTKSANVTKVTATSGSKTSATPNRSNRSRTASQTTVSGRDNDDTTSIAGNTADKNSTTKAVPNKEVPTTVLIAGDEKPVAADIPIVIKSVQTASNTPDVKMVEATGESDEEDIDDDDESDTSWGLGGLGDTECSTPKSPKLNGVHVRLSFTREASDTECKPPLLDAQEPTNDADEIIERLRREMVNCPPMFVSAAVNALREQIAVTEHQRLRYEERLLMTKRMQWCTVCLEQAIYYCCWRVSYCSSECQNVDWRTHVSKCKRHKIQNQSTTR